MGAYTSTNWVRTVGDPDAGAAADAISVNGTMFVTGETAADPAIVVDGSFTIGTLEIPLFLYVWGKYAGGGGHFIDVFALDSVSGLYENVGVMPISTVVSRYGFGLSPNHVTGSVVTIQFKHTAGVGIVAHALHLDKVQVDTSVPGIRGSRPSSAHIR